MLSFRSLTTKFLVIYLPLTCLSVLVLFAVLEFRTYRAQNDELVSNLNKIISSDSILYSKLLWDFDTKNIETMLLNLLQNSDLESAAVYDISGDIIAQVGPIEELPETPELRVTRPLIYRTVNKVHPIGRMIYTFHSDRIREEMIERLRFDALILIALAASLAGATLLVTRTVIGKPLSRLYKSIKLMKTENIHEAVRWDTNDELGQVVSAYNEMQVKQTEAEVEVKKYQDHLEEMVAKRTDDLTRKTNLLKGILSSLSEGLAAFDKDLKLIAWNDKFLEIRDYPEKMAEEGRAFADFMQYDVERNEFGPDDQEQVFQFQLERAREFRHHEFERQRPNGTYIKVSGGPISGGGFVSTYSDITERKKFERELAEKVKELDFQKFAFDEHAIVSISDIKGNITYTNDKFCEISGYSHEELLGQNHRILKSGEHSPEFYVDLWKTIANGKVWNGNIKNLKKGGGFYWVDATIVPFLDERGKPFQYVAIRTDITERKEAEKALEENVALVELLHSVTVTANEASNMDKALNTCLGLVCKHMDWPVGHAYKRSVDAPSRLVPTDIWYLSSPEEFETFREITSKTELQSGFGLPGRVMAEGKPAWVEDVTKDPNFPRAKQAKDIGVRAGFAIPVFMGNEVTDVLEFFSSQPQTPDETFLQTMNHVGIQLGRVAERVEAEEKLFKAKEEAESANQAKSDFLSAMSHELRTPMNAILGFGQMLDFNPKEPLTEAQKDCVRHIMKGGQHLLELINDILELAKIEAGKVKLSIEDVSSALVLDECLPLIASMAEKRGIDISVPGPVAEVPSVRADYTRLKQVLLNLMSNAVKYNRKNGKVTISFEEAAGNMLRIAVTDTGEGIPEDQQSELFKPFSRLGAENSEIEGTGIGLVVSKNLIEIMNGAIGLKSEVGKGSTFWIELPQTQRDHGEAAATIAAATAQVEAEGRLPSMSGTLLYVEDNPENLKLMELIVSRVEGLSMISTHTGELGIELARAEKPDVIILDINLPGMNGIEAVKNLHECESTNKIPVLAISAAATEKDIEKGLEAGFLRYLTKPVQVPQVINAIESALAG